MDHCPDNNFWCKLDKYHLDLSRPYLTGMGLTGAHIWNGREIHWSYIDGTPSGCAVVPSALPTACSRHVPWIRTGVQTLCDHTPRIEPRVRTVWWSQHGWLLSPGAHAAGASPGWTAHRVGGTPAPGTYHVTDRPPVHGAAHARARPYRPYCLAQNNHRDCSCPEAVRRTFDVTRSPLAVQADPAASRRRLHDLGVSVECGCDPVEAVDWCWRFVTPCVMRGGAVTRRATQPRSSCGSRAPTGSPRATASSEGS